MIREHQSNLTNFTLKTGVQNENKKREINSVNYLQTQNNFPIFSPQPSQSRLLQSGKFANNNETW